MRFDYPTPSAVIVHALIASGLALKGSRLREAALHLVADIYDMQYDLLETRGLIDRVEQAFPPLKK